MSSSIEEKIERWLLRSVPREVYRRLPPIYYIFNRIRYQFVPRPHWPKETAKAKARREREGFFDKYFQGEGIDIGYGGDLVCSSATGWDWEDGDATTMDAIFDETFDFAYSSHVLEHLADHETALINWWRILKPGGYLILYIPDRDLAEQKETLPSYFNADHKHFFTLHEDSPPDTVGILPLIKRLLPGAEIIEAKVCDEGYRSNAPDRVPEGEYSIEVVVRKLKS